MLNIVSFIIVFLTLYFAHEAYKKNKSLIQLIYFNRPLDYLWSLLILIGVFSLIGFFLWMKLPKFMTWSWFNLFQQTSDIKNSSGGNVISTGLQSSSKTFVGIYWLIISLALPYLAESEENYFRKGVYDIKNRILISLKFGLLHMIMGVPLFTALVIGIVGYVYSIFYNRTYIKCINSGLSSEISESVSIYVSTSVHTKYNFIIITLVALYNIIG